MALVLREAVTDDAERTAALITPDRALARRVVAALERWSVPVDDSGGDPLSDTAAGIFARLAAETALNGCEPVTLLALLKHPLCRLGGHESDRTAIALLERAILRGPRPRAGTDGLEHALQSLRAERETLHRSDPRRWLTDRDLDRAAELIAKLKPALAPLTGAKKAALRETAISHHQVVAALSLDHQKQIGCVRGTRRRSPARYLPGHRRQRTGCRLCGGAVRLCRSVPRYRVRAGGTQTRRTRRARADLRSAGGAVAAGGSRRACGPCRRRVATGATQRSLAQPADATATRARSAGATDRPVGA